MINDQEQLEFNFELPVLTPWSKADVNRWKERYIQGRPSCPFCRVATTGDHWFFHIWSNKSSGVASIQYMGKYKTAQKAILECDKYIREHPEVFNEYRNK